MTTRRPLTVIAPNRTVRSQRLLAGLRQPGDERRRGDGGVWRPSTERNADEESNRPLDLVVRGVRLTDLPGHRAQDHTVLGWSVPDIRAAIAELRARGVTFRVYEGFGQDADGIWSPPGGGARGKLADDDSGVPEHLHAGEAARRGLLARQRVRVQAGRDG